MKPKLHPQYFSAAKVHCACGHEFNVGATMENMEIEICSRCHPFYTGQEKIIDTAGRVERYRRRLAQKGRAQKAEPSPHRVKVNRPRQSQKGK